MLTGPTSWSVLYVRKRGGMDFLHLLRRSQQLPARYEPLMFASWERQDDDLP